MLYFLWFLNLVFSASRPWQINVSWLPKTPADQKTLKKLESVWAENKKLQSLFGA